MKTMPMVLSLLNTSALAHESLAPHSHPHGVSMLPGIDVIAWGLFALAAALIAYWRFRRTS